MITWKKRMRGVFLAAACLGAAARVPASGEATGGEAVASRWGFEAEDSTACLQAALDSGARTVRVDNAGSDWIVGPIAVPSDIEIVFADGVVVRMIHGCGQVDLAGDIAFTPGVVAAARTALRAGAPILCDARMVSEGITRARLPAGNPVLCTLNDPQVPALAATQAHRAGHEVAWLDGIASGWTPDEFDERLDAFAPEAVMIETKTPVVRRHWEIIRSTVGGTSTQPWCQGAAF